ncbi:hypothetical protein RMSM_01357 [Rhodopirellula maiorica SM1]|uniref:Uncharacterized protein n=1 Tax=Rhodopirellula maiorica SM1 TaxID=1265738 RepID=M5S256_9BACT|nr:hypothetical protein RMSM_01357 [Rhodopirellula maiorica SM1]
MPEIRSFQKDSSCPHRYEIANNEPIVSRNFDSCTENLFSWVRQ